MPDTPVPMSINRTLVLAVGGQGLAILRAFQERLSERQAEAIGRGCYPTPQPEKPYGGLPIASLAITCRSDLLSDNLEIGPTIRISTSDADQPEIQAALDERIDEVAAGITNALASISRVPQGIGTGNSPRSPEIDVYLIAGLDDPLAGVLIDIVYLARQLIERRLNTHARISGLLLLPDPLTPDDPEPALARSYAILEAVDACMGAHARTTSPPENPAVTTVATTSVVPQRANAVTTNSTSKGRGTGYRRAYTNGRVIDGWGPPFDGECFLIGALNRNGQQLESPQGREHLIAEALLQFITSPLGRNILTGEPLLQNIGRRPTYASLGLASLVYPARAVHEHLARRLARQILAAWASEPPTLPDTTQAVAFLTDHDLNAETVRASVLPQDVLAEAGIGHPIRIDRPWGQLDELRDAIDDMVAQRLEALNDQRGQLERAATALAGDLVRVLGDKLTDRLDHPQPAGIQRDLTFVQVLRNELLALARRETRDADAQWAAFRAASDEADECGKHLAKLGSKMAAYRPTTLFAALGLLLRPHRWLHLWRLWHELQQAKMGYIAHLERQMNLSIAILESDLLVQYLNEAIAQVEQWEHRLASLLAAIETAITNLARDNVLTYNAEAEPIPLHQMWFDLEWSALTRSQVGVLYEENSDDPTEELPAFAESPGRLSAWVEQSADASEICAALLAFARRRLRSVLDATAGQMLTTRYPDTDQQREAIENLLNATAPFIAWDETTLHASDDEAVHETVTLGVPAADSELVEAMQESGRRSAPVVPTTDAYRIVALRLVRGIPLAALPIIQEAATCSLQPSDSVSRR